MSIIQQTTLVDPTTEIQIEQCDSLNSNNSSSKVSGFGSFLLLCSQTKHSRKRKYAKSRIRLKKKCILIFVSVLFVILGIGSYFMVSSKSEWIYVHLIPHSHDDVGWLRTVSQYFYEDVNHILNNVVFELSQNSSRRFTYVETVFFWTWWLQQNENKRLIVKKLVENGQLEFAGGGWSMNDEAVTNYQCIIDQYTWGLRRLNDTFGDAGRPTVAWQIDAFGHSREMASILGQIGFDGVVFARIDESDREHRLNERRMELIWKGSSHLGSSSNIFTNIMFKHYNPPKGFHFEKFENQILNDDKKIDKFINHVITQAQHYRTNHVLIPMGDDFTYVDARAWFENIDKLIKYIDKKNMKINIFYSTPSNYLKSINNLNLTWPIKKGDFLPYASNKYSYWTGYYTSRPTLKYLERLSNQFLQTCKQMHSMFKMNVNLLNNLINLREAMGVVQHHDAITGTSKQYVTDDYVNLLVKNVVKCDEIIDASLDPSQTTNNNKWHTCLLLNISTCHVTQQSSSFLVTVYNPLAWSVSKYIRLPVDSIWNYVVYSKVDENLSYQITQTPQSTLNISSQINELLLRVTDVPALGYKTYHVKRVFQQQEKKLKESSQEDGDDDVLIIGNEKIQVVFNTTTGLMTSVVLNNDTVIKMEQELVYYVSVHHWSGAYAFRPSDNERHRFSNVKVNLLTKGEFVDEVEQIFSDWLSQIIRVYKNESYVEIEWLVGPIPNSDYFGKEVISLYNTNISNDGVFYTDSNGRETIKRKRNQRLDWPANIGEKVAGNYYPVTSRIMIRDEHNQLIIVNDRSQGGSSVYDGEIELMLHRRLCYDEGYGVGEPLNETDANGNGLLVRGKHLLFVSPVTDFDLVQTTKLHALHKIMDGLLIFKDVENDPGFNFTSQFSGLTQPLPENIHILTLEPWRENVLLLRLENIFEPWEDFKIEYTSTNVSLKNMFSTFNILWARETTLAANQWSSNVTRMKWRSNDNDVNIDDDNDDNLTYEELTKDMIVELKPLQIRTFVLGVSYK